MIDTVVLSIIGLIFVGVVVMIVTGPSDHGSLTEFLRRARDRRD